MYFFHLVFFQWAIYFWSLKFKQDWYRSVWERGNEEREKGREREVDLMKKNPTRTQVIQASDSNTIFTTNYNEKMFNQYPCWDLNPWSLEHESPPKTTWPRLFYFVAFIFQCFGSSYSLILSAIVFKHFLQRLLHQWALPWGEKQLN